MFQNKVVLVTGASSALGSAACILFARDGAKLAIVGRNEKKLEELADKCEKLKTDGIRPLVIKADLSIDEEARTIIDKTLTKYNQLDVLINNASIIKYAAITEDDILNVYDEVMNINIRSVILITSLAVPHLIKTKGNIVNVSPMMSKKFILSRYLPYMISDAAIDSFTRELSAQLMMHGVRVNSVKPGPLARHVPDIMSIPEELRHFRMVTLKSDPEENAGLVFYMACDMSNKVTGSSYVVHNEYRLVKL